MGHYANPLSHSIILHVKPDKFVSQRVPTGVGAQATGVGAQAMSPPCLLRYACPGAPFLHLLSLPRAPGSCKKLKEASGVHEHPCNVSIYSAQLRSPAHPTLLSPHSSAHHPRPHRTSVNPPWMHPHHHTCAPRLTAPNITLSTTEPSL